MLSLLLSDATPAGRFAADMLTPQQRMELLFTPDDDEDARAQLKGDPEDACTWLKVQCDRDENFQKISWYSTYLTLSGSVDFAMLPQTLMEIYIVRQAIRGTIKTSKFPETLNKFLIHSCFMSGLLDIDSLPPNCILFVIIGNQIDGISAFSNLPDTLEVFRINEPGLTGKVVRIGTLPASKLKINLKGSNVQSLVHENPLDESRVLL